MKLLHLITIRKIISCLVKSNDFDENQVYFGIFDDDDQCIKLEI